ncbi:geranylgeranylglyceryl/heptaprenylglyceryl phosphate synthase [Psychroserpens sp.]|uniref:geranylgeranylglyceryl/heptaprenylglyceryl phosphate synthase n=1 Tax=Psychroserpens sp. TaxID=2020870 RepID=UPI003C70F23B
MNTPSIYQDIIKAVSEEKKLLAVLIDPDKFKIEAVSRFIKKVNRTLITHVFVGGSTVEEFATEILVAKIKAHSTLPIVLFPGDVSQITDNADALLFLSLISGTNPDYLIGKHIEAVSKLKNSSLEVIPTGYVLIESGGQTSVEKVTRSKPLPRDDKQRIADTAKAGELLGMQCMYLEAGSGAMHPIPAEIISFVKQELNIPLIVGGGMRSRSQIMNAYESGADLIVIGTAFEEDETFFDQLQK